MKTNILILGAGFGGLEVGTGFAREPERQFPDHFDRQERFFHNRLHQVE